MFSVTLALIAIFGIALTNLFLGFASALLIGRGPRTWSDVDEAVTIRYFCPRLVMPRGRRTAEQTGQPSGVAAPVAATPAAQLPAETEPVAAATVGNKVGLNSPANSAAWDATIHRLVLPPAESLTPAAQEPPETVFAHQFETWRASDPREETPCLSGFLVTVLETSVDERVRALLMDTVKERIVGQLRKDRRVLHIADDQLFWFSADVPPDEGLMPVERIRQMLSKTRFLHGGNAIAAAVRAAVVAVSAQDDPSTLLQRIRTTLQYALEKEELATCVDVGRGPGFVQPPKLDLHESECVLE